MTSWSRMREVTLTVIDDRILMYILTLFIFFIIQSRRVYTMYKVK